MTGANRGLGFATARLLAESAPRSLLGARNAGKAELAAAELRDGGLPRWPLTLDVESAASIADATAHVEREFGRLDILVNHAGILPEATKPGAKQPLDIQLFRRTFDTNVVRRGRWVPDVEGRAQRPDDRAGEGTE